MNRVRSKFSLCLGLLAVVPATQVSALTLPPPNGLLDGIPYAIKYDDFWSYSAKLLEELRDQGFIPASFGPYDFATGSGGLDVLLYTGAGGQSNQGIGPGGTFNFEDPVTFANGGYWGQNDQDNDGIVENPQGPQTTPRGPVTVGNVLTYLQALDPTFKVPVFYLDLAQPGSNASLLVSARVRIIDPNDPNNPVAFWAFDTIENNAFDESAKALAAGEVIVQGASGHVYSVNHNLGSGKPDFIAITTPDLDLTQFNANHLFVVDFHFDNEAGAQEELFLTGARVQDVPPPTVVPEPAGLGLLALAGAGLLGLRRRR